MNQDQPRQPLPVVPLVIGGAVILIGCMLIGFILFTLLGPSAPRRATPTPSPTVTPLGEPMFPTATPALDQPTPTPTEEVTEEATEEPTEEPTNAPAPTSAPQPTAAPPTNTPEPTTAPASGRLSNVSFTVTNPTVNPDEGIIFNFSLTNASPTEELPLGIVGVVVYDSNGNNVHFHTSWTGWVMEPGKTENWTDTVAIGTSGSYKLQLSICYSSVEACQGTSGEWELAAPPVDIVVR
ncbi:MAG: hypothetical protein P8Z40_03040 [Chloroflexota bacterium]